MEFAPLRVTGTIPLAGIGVVWIHYALGYNLDFLGVVGIVLLIGVVVNNGIVLIDYANRLRAEGLERGEALLTAAERRFRPIMMTALTTIIGMVPVTLSGATSIGLSYTSFGLTLIGGLTTATLRAAAPGGPFSGRPLPFGPAAPSSGGTRAAGP